MQIEDAKVVGLVANTQLQGFFFEWTSSRQIKTIRLKQADFIQPLITIMGDNLLFLKEPIKINEME
jgi:hypothetical protein